MAERVLLVGSGACENGWLSMISSLTTRTRIETRCTQSVRRDDRGVRGRLSITGEAVVFRPRWYRRALGQPVVKISITQDSLCIIDLLNPKDRPDRVPRQKWVYIFTVDDSLVVAVHDRNQLIDDVAALFSSRRSGA
jgi:hypothetical protein